MYYTLEEAASLLSRAGHELSPNELLRAGAAGLLLIAVPLNGSAYSPTYRQNRDMCGLYVVPPRYLMEIEAAGHTKVEGVFSLDGKEIFFPYRDVASNALRITSAELERFAGTLVGRQAPDSATSHAVDKPAPRQRWQEDQIIKALRTRGYDPSALPPTRPGRSGPKAEARATVKMPVKVFDKAWQRLRNDGAIKEKKPS